MRISGIRLRNGNVLSGIAKEFIEELELGAAGGGSFEFRLAGAYVRRMQTGHWRSLEPSCHLEGVPFILIDFSKNKKKETLKDEN